MKGISAGCRVSMRTTEVRLDRVVARSIDHEEHRYYLHLEGGHDFEVTKALYDEAGNYFHSLFVSQREGEPWIKGD